VIELRDGMIERDGAVTRTAVATGAS